MSDIIMQLNFEGLIMYVLQEIKVQEDRHV